MAGKTYIPEQVWAKIRILGSARCWPWFGQVGYNGYGQFHMGRQRYMAHRVVYFLSHPGEIQLRCEKPAKDMKLVLHTCNNPACCNPLHLFLGTPKDNTQDMIKKGRRHNFNGENGQRAKLTNIEVGRIRKLCELGIEQKQIAKAFEVSSATVSGIKRRLVYTNAP